MTFANSETVGTLRSEISALSVSLKSDGSKSNDAMPTVMTAGSLGKMTSEMKSPRRVYAMPRRRPYAGWSCKNSAL